MTTRYSSRDELRSTLASLKHLDLTERVSCGKKKVVKAYGGNYYVLVGSYLLPDGRSTRVAVKCRRRFRGPGDHYAAKVGHS